MLEEVRKQYPDHPIVLSFFSPSGFEVRKNYEGADAVLYLPLDGAAAAKKFIANINPALVFWVKYEYWYFFLKELNQQQVPVLLVSGIFRPSQPFFKRYGGFWRKMLSGFHQLFIQDDTSRELLEEIGLHEKTTVSGDTRFDRVASIADRFEEIASIERFCADHRVIVAGSTWEEDDAEWVHYTKDHPEMRFIFAPHEVDPSNIRYVQKMFPPSTLFSQLAKTDKPKHILIIDNIGMLSKLYKYGHVTYVGGGFRESGIHNVLEAAVYFKPVIFGPVYEKFREARELVELSGAFSIKNALDLERLLDEFFTNEESLRKAGQIAGNYVQENRGATKLVMNYVQEKRLLTN